jgi:hypothetical protein
LSLNRRLMPPKHEAGWSGGGEISMANAFTAVLIWEHSAVIAEVL